ncbi:MAG: 4-hydroxy-tetrahydrodipicolinate reductase [Leptotrichiaceae bacterium]|jgi:4-hydroxy-tetrahydrodipicolinate reductase|nr:4-hydroxy-tetrahydrodipicolinate reductase [Leptotrichiaceae bacterium]MBP9539120.1 4-hydroxy-tetrahydrodipicolinate reductase [Leptotrichiaceae bacterium]MBP9876399.1 4-hydroxy-tetrahydrodipicolinate reductase [Leptotrichiaceae bacterium]
MNILVCGAGVMASFVKESIESSNHKCVGMYDPLGNGNYKDLKEIVNKIDGIIDFSHFSLTEEILKYAIEINSPLVIATTGHTDEQKLKIEEASKKIAILKATNTSLGVNIMNQIVSYATKLLADFDIELIEKHHNRKIDAPSGTAVTLLEVINESFSEKKNFVYGREGNKKREKNEIGVHAIRAGNIVGEHTVIFSSGDEIIEIKHEALSRKIFADGAVKAILSLTNKPSGLYLMKDILNINN